MTDAELIARLRKGWHTGIEAANRIEALIAERDEAMQLLKTLSNMNSDLSRDLYKTKLLLAKAVEALEYYAVEAMSWDADDSLIARTTLAEIKGESHE